LAGEHFNQKPLTIKPYPMKIQIEDNCFFNEVRCKAIRNIELPDAGKNPLIKFWNALIFSWMTRRILRLKGDSNIKDIYLFTITFVKGRRGNCHYRYYDQ